MNPQGWRDELSFPRAKPQRRDCFSIIEHKREKLSSSPGVIWGLRQLLGPPHSASLQGRPRKTESRMASPCQSLASSLHPFAVLDCHAEDSLGRNMLVYSEAGHPRWGSQPQHEGEHWGCCLPSKQSLCPATKQPNCWNLLSASEASSSFIRREKGLVFLENFYVHVMG